MKQLIDIPVEFIQVGDLILDFKTRQLQEVKLVSLEDKNGVNKIYETSIYPLENIFVDYGEDSNVADNFKIGDKVLILIDTEYLKITKPENIR